MELKTFKSLYKKFSPYPLGKDVWQTREYDDYLEAIEKKREIANWYLRQRIKQSKVKVGRHCCIDMTYHLTFDKRTKEINPDATIRFIKRSKIYGIPIHDGGNSFIRIEFCPWCGKRLTKKLQDIKG
jgi:hypothetical protein